MIEAIEAGKEIDKVLVKRELSGELYMELQQLLHDREIPMQRVPVERIDRVTQEPSRGDCFHFGGCLPEAGAYHPVAI